LEKSDGRTRRSYSDRLGACGSADLRGGLLWVVAASGGKKLAECKLESPPVFDGMVAARGRLYLALTSGRLICLGGT